MQNTCVQFKHRHIKMLSAAGPSNQKLFAPDLRHRLML